MHNGDPTDRSFTLREEPKLRVTENKVLNVLFKSKRN
jgi:hypothetical protein